MWAGGRVEFLAPLPIGARAQRRSIVTSVSEKQGKSGALVFVTVRHEITVGGGLALIEEQDLVFRDMPSAVASRKADARVAAKSQPFEVDVTFLFRFSALTFNAHRIHFDRGYATGVEGYEDLVVHGPLQAMLLLDHFCRSRPQASVARFSYRAEQPLFANQRFELNYQDLPSGEVELWTRDEQGCAGMTARVILA
jgi:3-methylfumaryl-CoA hydratase